MNVQGYCCAVGGTARSLLDWAELGPSFRISFCPTCCLLCSSALVLEAKHDQECMPLIWVLTSSQMRLMIVDCLLLDGLSPDPSVYSEDGPTFPSSHVGFLFENQIVDELF